MHGSYSALITGVYQFDLCNHLYSLRITWSLRKQVMILE